MRWCDLRLNFLVLFTWQFAGGLDSETMCAFEELRERAQLHRRGGSRELLHGVILQ